MEICLNMRYLLYQIQAFKSKIKNHSQGDKNSDKHISILPREPTPNHISKISISIL